MRTDWPSSTAWQVALDDDGLGIGGIRVIVQRVYFLALHDVSKKRFAGIEVGHFRIRGNIAAFSYEAMHGFLTDFRNREVVGDSELVRFRGEQPIADFAILLGSMELECENQEQKFHGSLRAVIFTGN
jgi:hypothetical protein